jgi:hypothetical protein
LAFRVVTVLRVLGFKGIELLHHRSHICVFANLVPRKL